MSPVYLVFVNSGLFCHGLCVHSVDPACLSMMTYSKFSGAPVTAKATNNPFWSPKGSLPVLRSPSSSPLSHPPQKPQEPVEITDFRSCVQHLKACGYSADYNLSSRQQSEVMAFSQLIEERLRPALLQVFWLDTKNQVRSLLLPCSLLQTILYSGLFFSRFY